MRSQKIRLFNFTFITLRCHHAFGYNAFKQPYPFHVCLHFYRLCNMIVAVLYLQNEEAGQALNGASVSNVDTE